MIVHKAFKFELDPNNKQRSALASHCGASRFAFNMMLAYVEYYKERKKFAPQRFGRLDASISWSFYSLQKAWNNEVKAWAAPWWKQNSKYSYESGIEALANALKNHQDSKKGKRKGPKMGWPNVKKGKSRRSCQFRGDVAFVDERHIRLPVVGIVQIKEKACLSRVEPGKMLRSTVSERAGRWFISIAYEVDQAEPVKTNDEVVGIDLGVKSLAVLSSGQVIPSPAKFRTYERRKARLQRSRKRRTKGSNRWKSTRHRERVCSLKIGYLRRDTLHKTTTSLAKNHGTIVVENLNVRGMSKKGGKRKRGLNKGILSAAPYEFRRQLEYKTKWYGSTLVVADRWFPSSKTCSACGAVRTKLLLSERTFRCDTCGLTLDRDLNAAINLKQYVAAGRAETQNGRGGDEVQASSISRCSPVKRQAGSPKGRRSSTRATSSL